jgi:predicted DNA-binding protein with PD1-like motif|tara:strand:- start:2595 stop:3026 length:432 start_codon:yes stop_codon:yes gene_type:complete
MQYEKIENGYMIYVEKGEKIMERITEFCIKNQINNAQLSGIGAVKEIEIGAFDTKNKIYIRQIFEDTWELVSYQGNVSLKDNIPFIHAHVTLSDHNLDMKGGHLFEATVAAVGEFFLRRVDSDVYRKLNENVGLPTLCMADKS